MFKVDILNNTAISSLVASDIPIIRPQSFSRRTTKFLGAFSEKYLSDLMLISRNLIIKNTLKLLECVHYVVTVCVNLIQLHSKMCSTGHFMMLIGSSVTITFTIPVIN